MQSSWNDACLQRALPELQHGLGISGARCGHAAIVAPQCIQRGGRQRPFIVQIVACGGIAGGNPPQAAPETADWSVVVVRHCVAAQQGLRRRDQALHGGGEARQIDQISARVLLQRCQGQQLRRASPGAIALQHRAILLARRRKITALVQVAPEMVVVARLIGRQLDRAP